MTAPDLANRLIFAHPSVGTKQPVDRAARWFVWACWLVSIATAFAFLGLTAQKIPLADDWRLIQPGGAIDASRWAWPLGWQSPLPRLIATVILGVSGDRLRLLAVFNVFALAAVAFAAIKVIRSRRGHTSYADAFLPLTLLHLGHAESFVWASQISQVVAATVAVALILSLVANSNLLGARGTVQAAAAMVLLSVSGTSGPIIAASLAGWCLTWSWVSRRALRPNEEPWAGKVLVGASVVAILSSATSLRASWVGRTRLAEASYSLGSGLDAGALGLGPAVGLSWPAASFAAGSLLLACCLLGAFVVRRDKLHLEPVIGVMVVLLSVAASGMAIGLGAISVARSEGGGGLPPFLIVTLPGVIAAYALWALYAPGRLRVAGPYAFFGLTVLLLPFNVAEGVKWGAWYIDGMSAVDQGLLAGVPTTALARRSQSFLAPNLTQAELVAGLDRLRLEGDGIGQLQGGQAAGSAEPARPAGSANGAIETIEIRYRANQAGEVSLIWGVSGWAPVAEGLRPPNTTIQNGTMNSPMRRSGEEFSLSVRVPAEGYLDYGFWTSKHEDGTPTGVWDGAYVAQVGGQRVVRTAAPGRILAQLQASATSEPAPALGRDPAPRPQAVLHRRTVAAGLIGFGLAMLGLLISLFGAARAPGPSTPTTRRS